MESSDVDDPHDHSVADALVSCGGAQQAKAIVRVAAERLRNAIGGTDLDKLHEAVKRDFLKLDEQEKSVRSVLTKMESGFIRRFMEFQHE